MYRLIPVALSFLVAGAHFLRFGAYGITLMCLSVPLALFIKRKWVVKVISVFLCFISFDWLSTAFKIFMEREAKDEPSLRMVIILSSVALFTLASTQVFKTKKMKERYSGGEGKTLPGTIAFFLTFIVLSYVAITFEFKVMLFENFLFAGGMIEVFWLAIYAGFFADLMQNYFASQYLRSKIWLFLSGVFFLQLLLGLFGFTKFLMHGDLKLPIPMTIIADPVFQNGGFIILAIFAATTILVGPAWCSFLCFFGAVDNLAACKQKTPSEMPKWRNTMQIGILAAIVIIALVLRALHVKPVYAAYLAGAFGLAGIGVIWKWSRRSGVMTYCSAYCPVGFLATMLGKLSPFRMRITDGCDGCGDCTPLCRYDALTAEDLRKRKPGDTCTLCGDCISACEKESIDLNFPMLSPSRARTIFIVLAISLQAIMLGIIRI